METNKLGKYATIIISCTLTIIISAMCALPILFWGCSLKKYAAVFCILVAVQLFIATLWNYFINNKLKLKEKEIIAIDQLTNAMQHVQVTCAYCGIMNYVEIYVGKKNTYECTTCNQTNAVQIQISCSRTLTSKTQKEDITKIFKSIDDKK